MLLSTSSSLSSKKQANQHKKKSVKREMSGPRCPHPAARNQEDCTASQALLGTVGGMETACRGCLAQMAPGFGLGKHSGQTHQQSCSPVAIPAATPPGLVGEGGRSAGGSPLTLHRPIVFLSHIQVCPPHDD